MSTTALSTPQPAGTRAISAALPPHQWTLTRYDERPPAHENVLARRTYRLENPDDPAQALWCYCDKRARPGGRRAWENRYGASQPAGPALRALGSGDVRALAKIFRQATRRTKQS